MANRVIWIPSGSRVKSSSRIQVYNIHDKLVSLGYNSQLLFEPKRSIKRIPLTKYDIFKIGFDSDDVVIIQKFKSNTTNKQIENIKLSGAKVGYIDCDEPLVSDKILGLLDFVITPSTTLQDRYKLKGIPSYYIPDCPENYLSHTERTYPKNDMLRCVWFGNHSKLKWKEVIYFKKLLRENNINNWKFETISNTYKATHRWKKNSLSILDNYDLVVIPVPEIRTEYSIKSSNRLLQSMALSLPVLASPIPSYVEITNKHNLNDLICETNLDWIEKLQALVSEEERFSMLKRNYEVSEMYSLGIIIEEWVKIFDLKMDYSKKQIDPSIIRNIQKKIKFLF